MGRSPCYEENGMKKGLWTPEEDKKLLDYIEKNNGYGSWQALPKLTGLNRHGKSRRLRWTNYLHPLSIYILSLETSGQPSRVIFLEGWIMRSRTSGIPIIFQGIWGGHNVGRYMVDRKYYDMDDEPFPPQPDEDEGHKARRSSTRRKNSEQPEAKIARGYKHTWLEQRYFAKIWSFMFGL
ncbi:hypothetical protein Droror1_Dr00025324 [Drosera rotundifolia]